ncbi:hypothetical protein PIROE2DRAFT_11533, partial [Piromyces sp. E2]
MKNIYKGCINSHNKDYDKNEFLMNFVNQYNITELTNNDGLMILLAKLHNYGYELLFKTEVTKVNGFSYIIPHIKNDLTRKLNGIRRNIAEIELSKKGLTFKESFKCEEEYNDYLTKNYEEVDKYKIFIKKVLETLYGPNENIIESKINSIMEAEKIFSQIIIDSESGYPNHVYYTEMEVETTFFLDNDNNNDNNVNEEKVDYERKRANNDILIKIKDFNKKYSLFNWKLYFEKRYEIFDIENPITDESVIREDKNFKYLYEYLKEINIKDLNNFIEWEVIYSIIDICSITDLKFVISDEIIQIRKGYSELIYENKNNYNKKEETNNTLKNTFLQYKKRYGILAKDYTKKANYENDNENANVKTKCINFISSVLPHVVSKYYIDMNFPDNLKSETKEMVENIIKAMIKRIQEIEWLDESTREYAISKVLKIKYILGYSDYFMNVENLYNHYKLYRNANDYLSLLMCLLSSVEEKRFKLFYNDISDVNIDSIIDK